MPAGPPPLAAAYEDRIAVVAEGLGARMTAATIARLAAWFDLLAAWNAKIDLTAAKSPDELVDLMLADAIVLARHEAPGETVVDVGSGAGGPGLAIHIVRPDLHVTLVEPAQKRVAFLRSASSQVPPPEPGSLRIVRSRVEDLRGPLFTCAVSRATFAPEAWLELAARLVSPQGAAWVFLAREDPPKIAGWQIAVDEIYVWPLTRAKRRAVRYKVAV